VRFGVRSRKLSKFGQSLDGWLKSILSRAPPCFGRHVKLLVLAAFAVVSTHQPALGPRGWLWPVLLMVVHKDYAPAVGTVIGWWWWDILTVKASGLVCNRRTLFKCRPAQVVTQETLRTALHQAFYNNFRSAFKQRCYCLAFGVLKPALESVACELNVISNDSKLELNSHIGSAQTSDKCCALPTVAQIE
jgi:hypothetical protein